MNGNLMPARIEECLLNFLKSAVIDVCESRSGDVLALLEEPNLITSTREKEHGDLATALALRLS